MGIAAIQTIETPKRWRAQDTSSSLQPITPNIIEDDFTDEDNWTRGTGWTVNEGANTASSDGSQSDLSYLINVDSDLADPEGKLWEITYTVTAYTAGTIRAQIGGYGPSTTYRSSTGTFTEIVGPANEASLNRVYLTASATFVGTVSNLIVKEMQSFGNNNHGQIYSGRGLEFDGVTDYLSLGGIKTLIDFSAETTQANRAWTVACWFYIKGGEASIRNIIGADASISSAYIGLNAKKMTLLNITGTWVLSDTDLESNTWYRGLWVFDGDETVTFYVNGVADGSVTITNTANYADLVINNVGFRADAAPRLWNGLLSDLQLWQGAFSADDAAFDYANPEQLALNRGGTSLTNSNLKIWYPMNDGHRGQQSYVLDASNTGLGDEIVNNGDFSSDTAIGDDPTGWTDHTSYTPVSSGMSSEQLYNGRNTYKIVGNSTSDGVRASLDGNYVSGFTYKIDIWVYVTPGSTVVNSNPPDNHFASGTQNIVSSTTTGEWEKITSYATANDDATNPVDSWFIQQGASGDCTFYIGEISIKPVNDKNHATTVFYGEELVTNGDSDSTLPTINSQNLANYDAASVAISTAITGSTATYNGAAAGDDSILVTADASGANYPLIRFLDGSDCGLETGKTYTFSAYVYLPGSQTMDTIKLQYNDGSDNLLDSTTDTNQWVKLSGSYVQNDQARIMEIRGLEAGGALVNGEIFYVDQISIKEQGIASGWTDADQQLDIPQTALQSYNQLLYGFTTSDDTGSPLTAVKVDDDSDIDFGTDDFSISVWFNIHDTVDYTASILRKGGWSATGYALAINSSHKPAMNFSIASDVNQWGYIDDSNLIKPGKWYHMVAVWDRSDDMYMYINGEKYTLDGNEDISAKSAVSLDNSDDLYFQALTNLADTSVFPGMITETSMWNKVLTQSEVNELYNDGKALDAKSHSYYTSAITNLKGYWRNNGLAQWKDLSSYENHSSAIVGSETILQQAGVDASRDCQGFLMNRQKDTNALNLCTNLIASGIDNGPHVDVQGPIELGTTPFSMTMWLKKYRDWDEQWILSQYVSDSTRWYLRANNSNPPRFQFYARAGSSDTSINVTDSSFDLDANGLDTWVHLGITTNRSNSFKWYINGSLVETDTSLGEAGSQSPDDDFSNGGNLTIGWNEDTNFDDHHFDGEIDDVMIYTNKEMSAAEVKRNYNAGKRSHRNPV